MVFSSPLFLFGFFPLFLVFYLSAPASMKNATVLVFSMLFYAWGAPIFVFVVLLSCLVDVQIVKSMSAASGSRRTALMWIGILANLGMLIYFKYTNFLWSTAQSIGADVGVPLSDIAAIALPIGISFVVFEKITYIVDTYRGIGKPVARVSDYITYVFLFPKLLAGPIVKYHDIEGQFRTRSASFENLSAGLQRFAIGLGKKILIADPMGEVANLAFGKGDQLGFQLAWIGAIAYSLQIYFDFSGYSDMAIGLARTMGFRIMENFNKPYTAIGFRDFWRRWHISLSTWIRDYLYVPLGGDKCSAARTYLNLWICFLCSGLWHGAAWTFVLWGAYHGLFLTLDRLFLHQWLERLPRLVGVGSTFIAVTVGWVIFRSPDLHSAITYLGVLVSPTAVTSGYSQITPDAYAVMAVALAICFLPAVTAGRGLRVRIASPLVWSEIAPGLCLLVFAVSLSKAVTVSSHPFLYFRF